MRKIVTLMLALGGFAVVGCGEDQADDDIASDPHAQLIDAGRVNPTPGADAGTADAGGDAGTVTTASARIEPRAGNTTLAGILVFEKVDGVVVANIKVEGAPPGLHGAHLHAKGDCSAADATSAGDHWNPTSGAHGAPASSSSHLGDLGNLTVAADGTGSLSVPNTRWTLGDGAATDVVGKAIVIHGGPDDLTTQPSGNSGARIGCGVVVADVD